jgi:hypothetical protein
MLCGPRDMDLAGQSLEGVWVMCVGVCKVDVLMWMDGLAKGWQKAHARQKNVLTTKTHKENDA